MQEWVVLYVSINNGEALWSRFDYESEAIEFCEERLKTQSPYGWSKGKVYLIPPGTSAYTIK